MPQNNFVLLLLAEKSTDKKIWVSIFNIVYMEVGPQDHQTIVHINEGNKIQKYTAFTRLEELLDLVNNNILPRKWKDSNDN